MTDATPGDSADELDALRRENEDLRSQLAGQEPESAGAKPPLWRRIVAVILAPFVAEELAAAGWSKMDVKQRLFETARLSIETWRESWLAARLIERERWPERVLAASETIPVLRAADDITLIVAGGDVPIPQGAYLPSWGFPPCRVARRVET